MTKWWLRAVPILMVVNTGVFVLEEVMPREARRQLFVWHALSYDGLAEGRWWQLVTHAFLHGGTPFLALNVFHLVVNMAGLWLLGRVVERVMGTGRFLALYFVSAFAGGLAQVVLTGGGVPLIGASGAVCGVLLAFTTMFPEARRVALLFFVIPIPMRTKYLGWAVTALSLIFLLTGWLPGVGHAAHLGGCVAGYGFARLAGYGEPTVLEKWIRRVTGRG